MNLTQTDLNRAPTGPQPDPNRTQPARAFSMNETPALFNGEVAAAEARLGRLNAQVAAMRAVLQQLLQSVVATEKRLDNSQAAQLLEANEQLVLSGLELQAEVDSSAGALDEVTRAVGLDSLTRLPNRTVLLDRLEQAIAGARRHRKRVAVLFLDLNNFKQVNDRYGHAAGDQVLQEVAACLQSLVRETDTVSRHGGDEFLMVLAEVAEAADAAIIADKVNIALRAASRAPGQQAPVTASIGISIYPDDGEDAVALISRADAAMYLAKQHTTGGFAFHARPAVGPPAVMATRAPSTQEQVIAEHERRHAHLVQANEQLVLAALRFEAVRDAADGARQLRADLLQAVVQELGDAGALQEPVQGEPIKQQGWRALDVTELARQAVQACRAAIDSRHQVVDVQIHPAPIGVCGDPAQLKQVLTRLLSGASDCTPGGGHIGLHVEPAGQSVRLLFCDGCPSIHPDTLATVLEPVVRDLRLPSDGEDGGGGNGGGGGAEDSLGMGLTTVRAVVEAHGGSVAATSASSASRAGQISASCGSRFTILLPMVALTA